ncbi:hypothetical protein CEXT_601421 [Caerostris extrusa]|uniref:Uncharacterized protein n=1 Tax=Caerostris extrusa TaxID=172846 RepID=A0AAV4QH36_CAEEX|nr:hypothetical protein CEXT_601421 [Caerostris extrusa]
MVLQEPDSLFKSAPLLGEFSIWRKNTAVFHQCIHLTSGECEIAMKKTARRKERKEKEGLIPVAKGEKGLKDIKTRRLPGSHLVGFLRETGNWKVWDGMAHVMLHYCLSPATTRHRQYPVLPYAGILCVATCTCWHAHISTLA